MIRPVAILLLLAGSIVAPLTPVAALAAVEQPVLLPLPELLKQLDPKQQWLLLPLADYEKLAAPGAEPPPPLAGATAFIASAVISARLVDGRAVELTADFTAINRGDGPALADLFANAPTHLGTVTLEGAPGVLAGSAPQRLLLPRNGRWNGTLRWSVPLAGSIQQRTGAIPLPLAGGLALRLAGDGRGSAEARGLARDGDGWRLVAPPRPLLDLAWLPGGGGDDAPVFGVTQLLDVQVQDGPRPLRWVVDFTPRRGAPPATVTAILPRGFTVTAALAGVARLTPTADGVAITRAAGAPQVVVEGLLAADAPVALPRIADAAWQGGGVRLSSTTVLACEPPPGWRPLGGAQPGTAQPGATLVRAFAVTAPDAGMVVAPLAADSGLSIATSSAVAVGPQRATLDQVLLVRAGGTRVFRLALRLPAGWTPTALRGADEVDAAAFSVPPADELAAGATVDLDLPAGLAPGGELAILFSAEAPTGEALIGNAERRAQPPLAALPVLVDGATRASHRLLLAAAPGIELGIGGAGWALTPDADSAPAGVRAELRSAGVPAPVALTAAPRAAAVDLDAVCWLLPTAEATWCRVDLRVAVRDGELARLDLDLPLARDADLHLTGDGLSLADQSLTADGAAAGPLVITAPRPWRGERLLRIEGRLAPGATARIPQLTARLPGGGRTPVVRRWAVLQAPAERDLELAAGPAARPIDADELPTWAGAIPGATIAGAWRLGDGDAGGWRAADRALAALPTGFIDDLALATQVGPGIARTRVACRLAGAGLGELDLGLPEGAELEQAAVDGAPAAVRRDGQRLLLSLPGRTLVELALRYALPLDGPLDAAGVARIPPPRFAGLPVTRTTWTVAVDTGLRASPRHGPQDMPLTADWFQGWQRPWLTSWRTLAGEQRVVGASPAVPLEELQKEDNRTLAPPPAPERPRSVPAIALDGRMYSGARSGAPQAAVLDIQPLAALRRDDLLGRLLALLAGLAVVVLPRSPRRVLLAAGAAAIPLTIALLLWQTPLGPLLACAEWLPLAVAGGWLASLLVRRNAP